MFNVKGNACNMFVRLTLFVYRKIPQGTFNLTSLSFVSANAG